MKTEHIEKLGVAGKIVSVFLKNRELSILTILVLAAWGIFSFVLMPKQYNPEIVAPAFTVTTSFPGASAEETYELITRPIEDKISELPDVDEISSQSLPGGTSIVTVKFFVGSDSEDSKVTLNQKLSDNMGLKPIGAENPIVQAIDPDDLSVLDIGLSSDTLSESSLRKLAFDVADTLKLSEGVSKYEIKGGRTNELEVRINGQSLAAHGLTMNDVTTAVGAANSVQTYDRLETDTINPIVSIQGGINDAETLRQTIIRHDGNAVIRLNDVATISYGTGDINEYVRETDQNGTEHPIVHIAFSKLKGVNSTTVTNALRTKLKELEGTLISRDVSVSLLNDEGATASDEIGKLSFDLMKSIAVVGILLSIFLGTRNALIASISIPLVLLAVFATGLLAGQTINRITLFALILSLGLLVDDAIVVVENIARYTRLYPNEKKLTLIIRAVDEVGGALALSTFTMALAFLPMAFVTGMMGPYMGPIPFFVPVALFASLIFSITLNPFLAFLFGSRSHRAVTADSSYESKFFFRIVKKIERQYALFLSSLLNSQKKRNRFLAGIVILLIISIALPLSPLVPFRMLPKADKDQFSVYFDMPDGTDITTTDAATKKLERLMLEDTNITSVESFVGTSPIADFNGLFKGSSGRTASNQATLKAHLTPHANRSIASEDIASHLRERLASFIAETPDATVSIVEDPPGPPVLATFLLKIKGTDEKTREAIVRDFTAIAEQTSGIVDISTSLPERSLSFTYSVNQEKAGLLGIAPKDITNAISSALSGSTVGLYHGSSRDGLRKAEQEHIVVRFAAADRENESALSLIHLTAQNGSSVPLTELITPNRSAADTAILSDERERTDYIYGEMEGRSVIYAVLELFPKLLAYQLPDSNGHLLSWSPLGTEYESSTTHEHYRISIDGEWKLTLDVFRDLGIAMGVAVFLIYFVLAAKAKSLFIPLIIMTSIPLALIGVLPGFAVLQALKGTYFNATSMIGVIALAGLSVKNAVIYLEYLEPLRKAGKPIEEALVEAGRIRLLPIALTSLAAILGSFTIVSDPVWEGLGWSIIFGLTASTVLTLLVFPLAYYLAARASWYHQEKTAE